MTMFNIGGKVRITQKRLDQLTPTAALKLNGVVLTVISLPRSVGGTYGVKSNTDSWYFLESSLEHYVENLKELVWE